MREPTPTRWHPEGETPLMAASRTGRVDAVKLLLSHGSLVNAADPYQEETALMWASAEGQLEVVKTLLAAGADPNLKAHVSTITERKDADHPSGGFTALMFAARNGHADVVEALIKGGADPKLTNADGASATIVAIVNDRFDLAKELLDLGGDPNDGSLYWAVDMHDGTTDMRAHDGSRLQPTHPNNLTALGLVKVLLDLGADVNKPFVGALHSTTLCCGASVNSSPFYRAATAADVEVLKLLLAHGAQIEWSPSEAKPKDGKPAPPGRRNPNIGKTPIMAALKGGLGASFAAGPGSTVWWRRRTASPAAAIRWRRSSSCWPPGLTRTPRRPMARRRCTRPSTKQHVAMIRALVAAGAKLDAVNKDNLTPLLLAEKPKKKDPNAMGDNPEAYHPKKDSRAEVVAALRELMHLGPNDPAPQPPRASGRQEGRRAEKKFRCSGGDEGAMRKIGITTALACAGIIAPLMAQPGASAPPKAGTTAGEAKYRAFVNQYCIACHSKRAANPAEAPINLEAASFDDLLGHAETWERVIRKLSVRAMPPPGVPRPSEAEYAAFTNWLAASLDRAWEGHSTPGRFVVHRLNRAEYANAVRDLLAVDMDVSDLLPTDGAEFGFDNIATALKTSPLLLEGYVNAAERVSAMAVGDPRGTARDGGAFHQPRIQPERIHRWTAARNSGRYGCSSRFSG